jgi:hypothetical protein
MKLVIVRVSFVDRDRPEDEQQDGESTPPSLTRDDPSPKPTESGGAPDPRRIVLLRSGDQRRCATGRRPIRHKPGRA